jgi:hypothetical protein
MDDFYNGPAPLWLAFALTVLLMALAVASLRSVRGRGSPFEVKMFVFGMDAIALLWVPFWFVYGVLTRKFS